MTPAELVRHLVEPRPPWTVTVTPDTWAPARATLAEREGVRIIELLGVESRTKAAFLAAAARAFRFPAYFGHNWDALEECLRDLEWLPARAYVVAIFDAQHLLADAEAERTTLDEIIATAGEHWARARVPFHAALITRPR